MSLSTPAIDGPIHVAALYRFARFDDPQALRGPLAELCTAQGVKGTLLLAQEGINGTIAGSPEGIAAVLAHIRSLPDCAGIEVKFSGAATMPFHRMKVRVKREIVTMGQPGLDPRAADWGLCRAAGLERADRRSGHDRDRHAQRLRSGGRHSSQAR